MKIVSVSQMRTLDSRTIEEFGVPGYVLMERAGRGVAEAVVRLAERAGVRDRDIALFAGHGNNGGDAFAVARHLREWGWSPVVWVAGDLRGIGGDARRHLHRCAGRGIPIRELAEWPADPLDWPRPRLVVDGLLGVGVEGPAHGTVLDGIRLINALARDALVVAIDVPSGLNADTGEVPGEAVQADITVTIALPKQGLVASSALNYVGSVEVVDIGIPASLVAVAGASAEFISAADVRPMFRRRDRAAHKGDFGHLLIVTGAAGYAGAAAMAAQAALRSGAGLVTAVVPRSIAGVVAGLVPEAMVHGADETPRGSLQPQVWDRWQADAQKFGAVVTGPGLTAGPESAELVTRILAGAKSPVVLDADALNVLAGRIGQLRSASVPIVLTPHPGEMARLIGATPQKVQASRREAAQNLAKETRAVVVLKGAGTVVASDGQMPWINGNGNPGMATGGTGDVLAGMIGGLLAQGFPLFDAARAAVYLHGFAGDSAAWKKSEAGLTASDIIAELPYALRQTACR